MNRILTILLALTVMTTVAAKPERGGMPPEKGNMPPQKEKKASKKAKADKKRIEYVDAGKLYIYGVALSPMDSVVYITDELQLDSAQLEKKTEFLFGRESLSKQLADFMANKGEKNRICSITFANSVKDIDKKYGQQVKKLQKQGYLVKHIDQGEFRFVAIRKE